MATHDSPNRPTQASSARPAASPFAQGRQSMDPSALSATQLAESLLRGVSAADEARTQAVSDLARLRQARGRQLEAEQKRLRGRPGAEARLQMIDQAVAANARSVTLLQAEAERARVEVPEPTEGVYRVHGLVRSATGRPVAGHTVTLVDVTGRAVPAAGYACTDADGTFLLSWGEKGGRKDPEKPHRNRRRGPAEAGRGDEGARDRRGGRQPAERVRPGRRPERRRGRHEPAGTLSAERRGRLRRDHRRRAPGGVSAPRRPAAGPETGRSQTTRTEAVGSEAGPDPKPPEPQPPDTKPPKPQARDPKQPDTKPSDRKSPDAKPSGPKKGT